MDQISRRLSEKLFALVKKQIRIQQLCFGATRYTARAASAWLGHVRDAWRQVEWQSIARKSEPGSVVIRVISRVASFFARHGCVYTNAVRVGRSPPSQLIGAIPRTPIATLTNKMRLENVVRGRWSSVRDHVRSVSNQLCTMQCVVLFFFFRSITRNFVINQPSVFIQKDSSCYRFYFHVLPPCVRVCFQK